METVTPMMACGHAANSVFNNAPACAICFTINGSAATTVVETPIDLSDRQAICAYDNERTWGTARTGHSQRKVHEMHDSLRPSDSTRLAFFEYRPTEEFDKYYCGCWGWN